MGYIYQLIAGAVGDDRAHGARAEEHRVEPRVLAAALARELGLQSEDARLGEVDVELGEAGAAGAGRIEGRVVGQVAAVLVEDEREVGAVAREMRRRRQVVELIRIDVVPENRDAANLIQRRLDRQHGACPYCSD